MPQHLDPARVAQALAAIPNQARQYRNARSVEAKMTTRKNLHQAVAHAVDVGATQTQAAKASGLSKAQVSRLVRGATSGRTSLPPATYLVDTLPAAEVCVRYRAGESTVQIAEAYGCGESTIITVLKRNDVPRRVGRKIELPVSDTELARRYLDERVELQQLARELGVKPNLVSRRVAAAGVKVPLGHRRMDLPDAEIVRRYKAGESANQIAKSYGVCHVTVMRRVREDQARGRA
ncbi:hypothetical protein [Streptomyces sp. NPDC058985]|uniref:hypothetical protein n=1 Tax=Streptomyces sp. NPDC058985 TaxID=3346684 RepID=UPI0036CF2144